jgi:hypothetical protein
LETANEKLQCINPLEISESEFDEEVQSQIEDLENDLESVRNGPSDSDYDYYIDKLVDQFDRLIDIYNDYHDNVMDADGDVERVKEEVVYSNDDMMGWNKYAESTDFDIKNRKVKELVEAASDCGHYQK